jgi:hypothetical protein
VGRTLEDVDRLVAAVASFTSAGPALDCCRVGGRFQPVDDPRPLGIAPEGVARAAGCGPDGR